MWQSLVREDREYECGCFSSVGIYLPGLQTGGNIVGIAVNKIVTRHSLGYIAVRCKARLMFDCLFK